MTVRDIDPGEPHDEPLADGRKVVAVIGINRYRRWPTLDNAVHDATGALDAFHRLGFDEICPPLLDDMATGDALRRLVSDDLSSLSRDDSLVLFFAGHGHTQTRQLYGGPVRTGFIVPVDGDAPGTGTSSWLRVDTWLSDIARLAVRHALVVLDACHSGIALGSLIKWRGGATTRSGPLDSLRRRQSRRVITSALEDQRAMDSGPVPGHSLFTGCLIEALTGGLAQGGRTEATTSELGVYVQERVTTYPGSQQTPDFGALELDQRGELVVSLASRPGSRGPHATSRAPATGTAPEHPTFAGRTTREWERDLRSTDPAQRRDAAWGLGQIGRAAASALPTLLDVLHTTEPSFELVDAIGLIAATDERALMPLARSLGAPEERTRARAAELLVGHGTRALDLLLRAVEDPQRTAAACVALSRIGTPAIAPLLDLASASSNRALSTAIHYCIGAMKATAIDEVARIAHARAERIPTALEALERVTRVLPSMVELALAAWSAHLSPRCDELAMRIALRGGHIHGDLPLALLVAAFTAGDPGLVASATEALVAMRDTGVAVCHALLSRRDESVLRTLLPVLPRLGARVAELGPMLVELWRGYAGAEGWCPDMLLDSVMRLCPRSASLDMLQHILDSCPEDHAVASALLIEAGPPGLGRLLSCLEVLSEADYRKAEAALAAAAGSAAAIVQHAGVRRWPSKAFAFCAGHRAYAEAAVLTAWAEHLRESHDEPGSPYDDARAQALRVLRAAPEAALHGVASRGARRPAVDPRLLDILIAELAAPLETFARLVPLLADDAVRHRAFPVLAAFPRRLWRDQQRADGTARALDDVERAARVEVRYLRKRLRLDGIGRMHRALGGLGAPAAIVVAVIAGAMLSPMVLHLTVRYRWRLVMALASGAGCAVLLRALGAVPGGPTMIGVVFATTMIGVAAGTAARMVLDAISGGRRPATARKLAIGFDAAAIPSAILGAAFCAAVDSVAASVLLIVLAGVLGAVSAASDRDQLG